MTLKKLLNISILTLFLIGVSFLSVEGLKNFKLHEKVSSTYDLEPRSNHGKYKEYYANGRIKSIDEYKDGVRDGFSVSFDRNGDTSSIVNYVDGYKHGFSKYYASFGELTLVEEYNQGTLVNDSILNDSLYKYDLFAIETGSRLFTKSCGSCHSISKLNDPIVFENIDLDTVHAVLLDSMVLDSTYFSSVTEVDFETLLNYVALHHKKDQPQKIPFLVFRKKHTRKI